MCPTRATEESTLYTQRVYAKPGAGPTKGRGVFPLYYITVYTCTHIYLDFISQQCVYQKQQAFRSEIVCFRMVLRPFESCG